jgi:Zn-dependent protease
MTSGWRIGSILGIPFLLNPAWFYSLAMFTLFFGAGQAGLEGIWVWVTGLVMALLLFASVLLHELGHSLVARAQGIRVNSITLFPFGGIAAIEQESRTPGQAFRVAIAGPAVSFGLFMLLVILSLAVPDTLFNLPLKNLLGDLANINFVLALFNMMPGLPLDGGQVLKAAIWKITGSRVKGVRWSAQAGQGLGWLAILLGIAGFLMTLRFSFLWLVLLGGFGIRRASAYRRMVVLQEAMLQLQAADAITSEFRVVAADQTLEEFAAAYLTNASTNPSEVEVYYAESEGRYLGLVPVEALRTTERSQWRQQQLDSIIQPFQTTLLASTSLAAAIHQLETENLPRLPVLSAAGAVVGVFDRVTAVRALAAQLKLQVPAAVIEQIKATGQFPPSLQLQSVAQDALK